MKKETKDDSPAVLRRSKVRSWESEAVMGGEIVNISATEWTSGNGFDLCVGDKTPVLVTWDEFEVMKVLLDMINTDYHLENADE